MKVAVTTEHIMPFRKTKSVRITEGLESFDQEDEEVVLADGGTGGDPGVGSSATLRKSMTVLRLRSRSQCRSEAAVAVPCASDVGSRQRRDSQQYFAEAGQTVVVFDWDDTLFPTSYLSDDLKLDFGKPLEKQPSLPKNRLGVVRARLSACEAKALAILRNAKELSHVVVVTLASSGWVTTACENFYPAVGKLLKELQIPVIYAQERESGLQKAYDKAQFKSNEDLERYWGMVKGQAIADEVGRFYTQYEGQSWKNILSVGDSCFERYGLLAASTAYMQGTRLQHGENLVWSPSEEGCWEKVINGHVRKLRAKCCKLVDSPALNELTLELDMVNRWLSGMISLDEGFDLDLEALESEEHVAKVESVIRGERPVSELPRPRHGR